MGSLRSITVLASLLIALLAGAQATPSTATTVSRQDAAPTSADCTSEAAHCIFMPWMRIPAPPPVLQPLATIPGDFGAVEIHGTYAYLGQNDVLYVVDVRDPRQPRVVGGLQLKDFRLPYITDIEVQPPLAYVSTVDRFTSCCFDVQLHLVDISQPARPRLIASSSGMAGGDIEVVDQRVYATSLRWFVPLPALEIIDVVNSSNFVKRGSYGSNGSASVAVNGSIVYVAEYENGVRVFDAGDPDDLKLLATVSTPDVAYDVEVDGSYLYVAIPNGLAVYDIRTPQAPVVRSSRQLLGYPTDLEVASGRAYVTFDSVGLSILDVRNPDAPELLTTYPLAGSIRAVEVDGALLYLASSSGLHIAQVTSQ